MLIMDVNLTASGIGIINKKKNRLKTSSLLFHYLCRI